MKKRRLPALLLGLILLCLLPGCSLLPPLAASQPDCPSSAALEVCLGSALPEDVVLTWDPAAVSVDSAEVSVTEDGSGLPRTVTVTVRLRPCP